MRFNNKRFIQAMAEPYINYFARKRELVQVQSIESSRKKPTITVSLVGHHKTRTKRSEFNFVSDIKETRVYRHFINEHEYIEVRVEGNI